MRFRTYVPYHVPYHGVRCRGNANTGFVAGPRIPSRKVPALRSERNDRKVGQNEDRKSVV